MYLSGQHKRVLTKKGPFGARIKIMWEEQLVDPPIDYMTPVNVP